MSARQFNYFDDWKVEILECPKCSWKGTFEQGSVEHYMEQMDSACPKCDVSHSPILAIVLYPTLPELRANIDKPGVREWVERIDRGFDEFESQKLREPSQLPDIGESSFELVWDFDDSKPHPSNSGKTMLVASTYGVKGTDVIHEGHRVAVVANAFIYPSEVGKKSDSGKKQKGG